MLDTIVAKAAQLFGTEAGAIYVRDGRQEGFQLRATYGMSDELVAAIRDLHGLPLQGLGKVLLRFREFAPVFFALLFHIGTRLTHPTNVPSHLRSG